MIFETPNFYCVKVNVDRRSDVSIFYGPAGLRIRVRTGEDSGFTSFFNIKPVEVYVDSIFATWNCGIVTVVMRKRENELKKEKIIELC